MGNPCSSPYVFPPKILPLIYRAPSVNQTLQCLVKGKDGVVGSRQAIPKISKARKLKRWRCGNDSNEPRSTDAFSIVAAMILMNAETNTFSIVAGDHVLTENLGLY